MIKDNKEKIIETLKENLGLTLEENILEKLCAWEEIFLEYNSHTNLMSKNDTNVLFEKHVFDSLSIFKWDKFLLHKKILDVGTGGGFPSVILAICFPNLQIIANDSRIKKINFIKEIKEKLNLENLEIAYSRIEDVLPLNVDLILSRAVGEILNIWELSKKHLNSGGNFVIYKSKGHKEEIQKFKQKYKNAKFKIIDYRLPLKEEYERNLVILEKI